MSLSALVGLTLRTVEQIGDDVIRFESVDGRVFRMEHRQDCCETVAVEDICGELSDLVGSPIVQAEESSRDATDDEASESGTWTFYRIATAKGGVTIRWLGRSNGYYSERVDFSEVAR